MSDAAPLLGVTCPAQTRTRRRRLAAIAVVASACITAPSAPASLPAQPGQGDLVMYRAIVARVRAGEDYHLTVGDELRSRGYASREIFNWRTPLHLVFLAAVPEVAGRVLLVALVAAVAAGAVAVAAQAGLLAAWAAIIWSIGQALLLAAPDAPFLSEAWAGALIGASVLAFARERPRLAVALGLLALFVRELAAPYCVVCALAAAYRRRWREVSWWVIGAITYFGYYAWHVSHVIPLRLDTDLSHPTSWLELGGLPFILATLQWSGWLFMLPSGWRIVAGVTVAAGLMATKTPPHVRLAGVAYLLWYAVVGKPFDHYWGLMAAPVWAVCIGFGAQELADSLRVEWRHAVSRDPRV